MTASGNHEIQELISEYAHSTSTHKQALYCCDKLIDAFKEYEDVLTHPDKFIANYFAGIRGKISEDQSRKLQAVNKLYDHLVSKLNNLEKECVNSIPDDHGIDQDTLPLKQKLNEWIAELSSDNLDESRCKIIKSEAKILDQDLQLKDAEHKMSRLLKKSVEYQPTHAIDADFEGKLVVTSYISIILYF